MAELQLQMRVNQSELEQYVHELNNWEDDIKQKEVQLKKCDRSQGDVAKETVSAHPLKMGLIAKCGHIIFTSVHQIYGSYSYYY